MDQNDFFSGLLLSEQMMFRGLKNKLETDYSIEKEELHMTLGMLMHFLQTEDVNVFFRENVKTLTALCIKRIKDLN